MKINAAGCRVDGSYNPNWKGGLIEKLCSVCQATYFVKRVHSSSKYCSIKCVGVSQRGRNIKPDSERRTVEIICKICTAPFLVFESHKHRYHCCSKSCSHKRRSLLMAGDGNANWFGGLSRFPYPWNFNKISKSIIKRDGFTCQNPTCSGTDKRLTTHHINYEKQDCSQENLIALCSACNSKANFNRNTWMLMYQNIISDKKDGGGWMVEDYS